MKPRPNWYTIFALGGVLLLGCEALLDPQSPESATAGQAESCTSAVSISVGSASGSTNGDQAQLGAACSPTSAPTNCLDGTHIVFMDTGECVCIAQCETAGAVLGETCDTDGLYRCQTVSGQAGGPYCIATNWELCGDLGTNIGGTTGGESSSGDDGTTGGDGTTAADGEPQCKPEGLSCEDDAECCSLTCYASGCG